MSLTPSFGVFGRSRRAFSKPFSDWYSFSMACVKHSASIIRLRDAPIDEERKVTGADALAMTRRLHREFGLLVGTSSGANVVAALRLAGELGLEATVATVLCDRAERYFSAPLFADD